MITDIDIVNRAKGLTAKEVIMVMVEGLRKPRTVIDMGTYGHVGRGAICFGCAATNAICTMMDFNPIEVLRGSYENKGTFEKGVEYTQACMPSRLISDIRKLEMAFDYLRLGSVQGYNRVARRIGLAKIQRPQFYADLPILTYSYTEEQLQKYVELANNQ